MNINKASDNCRIGPGYTKKINAADGKSPMEIADSVSIGSKSPEQLPEALEIKKKTSRVKKGKTAFNAAHTGHEVSSKNDAGRVSMMGEILLGKDHPLVSHSFKLANELRGKPVISEDGSLIFQHGLYLAKYTSTGAQLWQTKEMVHGMGSMPIQDSLGNIYLNLNGAFGSIAPDGKTRWKIDKSDFWKHEKRDKPIRRGKYENWEISQGNGTPAIDEKNKTVYYPMYAHQIVAADSDSGKLKWIYYHNATFGDCRPVLDKEGNVYFRTEDSVVHGLRPDGTTIFTKKLGNEHNVTTNVVLGDNGLLYAGLKDGNLLGLNPKTGKLADVLEVKGRICEELIKTDDGKFVFLSKESSGNRTVRCHLNKAEIDKKTGRLKSVFSKQVKSDSSGPKLVDSKGNIYVEQWQNIQVVKGDGNDYYSFKENVSGGYAETRDGSVIIGRLDNSVAFLKEMGDRLADLEKERENQGDGIVDKGNKVVIGGVTLDKRQFDLIRFNLIKSRGDR